MCLAPICLYCAVKEFKYQRLAVRKFSMSRRF